MLSPSQEINFWTGIMRDHAEFILTSLSFREQEALTLAQMFQNTWITLNNQSKNVSGTADFPEVRVLIEHSMNVLVSFINFKRLLLRRLLECNIELGLPPTFVNHMINEAMEFYRTLCGLLAGVAANPLQENLQLHKIWLPDAAGHAASIAADLDPTETELIKEAEAYKNEFEHLYIKAVELAAMLERTGLEDGALKGLNEEVMQKISDFINFLDRIYVLRKQCKVLGVFKPLVPSHMIREEKYYLAGIERL